MGGCGARTDRLLSDELCARFELATSSTLAHLCATLGSGMAEVLVKMLGKTAAEGLLPVTAMRNDAGLTAQQVSAANVVKVFSASHTACWTVLEKTLLRCRTAPRIWRRGTRR